MNECCFKNSLNQDSLYHFVLMYSKDGAQSILENVFHNVLCQNVEYWVQHSLDYIVSGHKSVVTLLIQLDIDQRDRMWTSILDLTFRSTRVRHWVMVACISAVEKDSGNCAVLQGRLSLSNWRFLQKFPLFQYLQPTCFHCIRSISLQENGLIFCSRVEGLNLGPPR